MGSDAHKKHAGNYKIRCLMKIVGLVMVGVGVAVAMRMQDKMIGATDQNKAKEAAVVAAEQRVTADTTSTATKEVVNAGASSAAAQEEDDLEKKKEWEDSDSEDPADLPGVPFDEDRPLFVLSLPHNGDLVLPRYLECAGIHKVGRYWTHNDPNEAESVRQPLGKCFQYNIQQMASPVAADAEAISVSSIGEGCGRFSVWADLQYLHPPIDKGPSKREAECFDPVLFPGSLEKLYQAYPQALIVTVQRKFFPQVWLEQLPKDIKTQWKKWCNPTHDDAFPKTTKTSASADAKFIQFYQDYYSNLEKFIESHEGWGHVSINWDEDPAVTAKQLEEELKLPAKCWTEALEGEMVDAAGVARKPSDIPFPMLITSLPKSGTASTLNYFECGLGTWTTAHQWTTPSDSTPDNPLKNVPIGQCFEDNIKEQKKDVLKGCGHARIWSDVGYVRDKVNDGTCYYPTMDTAFMEAFAKYYPHASILHVVRNASDWFDSADKWNNLPKRWAKAENCHGFPADGTDKAAWMDFYQQYTQSIRDFAAAHANITYMEIPLSQNGGQHLQSIFGFHPKCWGNENMEMQR